MIPPNRLPAAGIARIYCPGPRQGLSRTFQIGLMKIKKRWLTVVLISFTQLAVMLVGVIYFSNYAETTFRAQIERNVLANNEALLQSHAESLESQNWIYSETGSINQERSVAYLSSVQLPNNGNLSIIDLQTGNLIAFPEWETGWSSDVSLGQEALQAADGKVIIGHSLSKSPSDRVISGVGLWNSQQDLVSATRLGNSKYALVATQSRKEMDAQIFGIVQWLRNFGFGITLFIGLVCTSLSVAVLRRYDDRVASHSSKLEQLVENRSRSLMKTKNAIIFGLAKLAESRDTDTGEHLDRIRRYVTIIANQMQHSSSEIDEKYISNIGFASSLHDIGKVGIPDGILLKPGSLTTDERFIMEQHAVIGGECLEAIENKLGEDKFLEMARKIAYAHHERWDGTGYPFQLAGHDIPLEARIVSVADVYDALTTKRPYKKALSHDESKSIIVSGVGTQFDPDVVDAFLKREEEFRQISESQTGDPMPAIMAIDHAAIVTPTTPV